MADTFRIRKGQYCVIGERHSSTMMHGATGESWTYSIGRVRKADAKGNVIKEADVPRYNTQIRMREDEQGRWWQSWAIRGAEWQAKAAALYPCEFDNLEYLREALRNGHLPSINAA